MQKMVYLVFNPTTGLYLGVHPAGEWVNLDEAKVYNTKSGARAVCQRLRLSAVDILEAQTILSFTGKVTKIK